MEGFGRFNCHHRSWVFNFRPDPDSNPRDTSQSEDEEEQRIFSDHNELACDIVPVKSALHSRRSVNQEPTKMRDDSFASPLLILNNVSVVLRLYLHYLRPNNQRVAEAENAIYSADGLCRTYHLCDGESAHSST